jgi:hypothetical protein
MIYTLIRLGFDGIYTISKLSYDGVYYMIYGYQETSEEKMTKEIIRLKTQMDGESLELREIKQLLHQIIQNKPPVITEEEEDIVLVT